MCLLVYYASTGTRSLEHSADVSASSDLSFFLSGPSLTTLDGSFLLTRSTLFLEFCPYF